MNPKYIVIELQNNADGTVSNLVYTYDSKNEAESKYHLVLSSAAVSQVRIHAAMLATTDGKLIASQHYIHIPEPEPTPEPEQEPEPESAQES